ncbi:glycosyltransferase [Pseudonocardia acaciae]|uniref:glycosyltransferase n=1 Tax=Pseudonocardia acaciae TaxID=551276 RepID=UPI00068455D8
MTFLRPACCDHRVSGGAALGAVAVAVWLWLLACHGRFWRTDQRLPPSREPGEWPSVAVVVPARDEAEVLPASLPSLLAQRYAGRARVILVDDNSGDGTAEVAARLAAAGGLPLVTTRPGEPPAGWSGKLWALAHGVDEAGDVDYLLFTDADIAHGPDSLAGLVAAASEGRDLVSLMAVLRTETAWERLVVPAFVYFFAMLYPFRWVNRAGARTAAAAGGCVLVRREALAAAGGIAAIRGALIDDVALARLVKRAGGRTWLGLADDVRSVRPYPRLADLWRMVARSAYTQLRYSPVLLAGTVLGLALVFLAPPAVTVAGALAGDLTAALLGALAWLGMAASYVPMLRYYGRPVLLAPLLPVTALLYTLMTLDSARRHRFGRGASWKGREYRA